MQRKQEGTSGAAMKVAERALRLAQSVAQATEGKRWQQTTTQTNYLAGVITAISDIPQGDGVSQRTGNSVRLKRLDLRLRLATFTDSDAAWRIIVFTDTRQVFGTAPTVLNVLDTDSSLAAYALAHAGRFRIFKDMVVNQNARFLNGDMADDFHLTVPLNMTGRWSGASVTDGQVYVLITCDVASAVSMVGKPAPGDSASRFTVDIQYQDD